MRGRKRTNSARTIAAGHAFVHRGHYELTTELARRCESPGPAE
jgi:hypothetical protein